MRSAGPQYPVDRYLVESSNKIEMVNIIDDDIWKPEPALRPEEEIMLRKLHEMLQSTADDLKMLSGELVRSREPAARARAPPAPLDEQFNEKVHIEEVVNAKFHGYKIVDKHPMFKEADHVNKPQNVPNTGTKVSALPTKKTPMATKRLTTSRTNVVEINATQSTKDKVEDVKQSTKETVAYSEYSFEYPKTKVEGLTGGLQVQTMPSINIRSELKEQKVLHLDIVPESVSAVDKREGKSNVAVIRMQHDGPVSKESQIKIERGNLLTSIATKKPIRKVTKIVTCESSTSTNNISSDPQCNIEIPTLKNIRGSPKTSARIDRNKTKNITTATTQPQKRTHFNLDEWKNKLNSVYGKPSSSRKNKSPSKPKGNVKKISPKTKNIPSSNFTKPQPKLLNNAQYIPYSQLTLGGVNVSDIEKEISNIPNKNNIPLSPILDKIISSRENSRHNSPRKNKQRDSPKILTTSDENLLQEVIDIEKTVSKTLSKNLPIKIKEKVSSSSTDEDTNEPDSYADDFEDDKSDNARSLINNQTKESHSDTNSSGHKSSQNESSDSNVEDDKLKGARQKTSIENTTFTKLPNLTLKNRVDIFEYVHAVDTQDTATQSQTTNKISLKETQTSPRNEIPNTAQPIHNDLWPSMDPGKQVEKMFKLEKDLIKKLIIDEYGDLLQRSIDKPSTSKENQESHNTGFNVAASQKVTQTSPKKVKSVMTSPTKTKTRTTSPFPVASSVDHQTSPMILITNEEQFKVEIEQEPEELGISINLSSPRFSLRLPNTSLEVLSNLEICSRSPSNAGRKKDRDNDKKSSVKLTKTVRKNVTSSTSIDADNSSSEISSLGEIKLKLKKRLKKSRALSLSESSSSSSKSSVDFNSAGILPLRSEGEISSVRRPRSRASHVPGRSDGEISFGNR